MSRIIRYQDSVKRFIKGRSCIITSNKIIQNIVDEHISDSEFLIPIILLTIMNNQNKKNKISLHGYYMASGMEFLYIVYNFIDKKAYYMLKYGPDKYYQIIISLIMCINNSLSQNIDTIQSVLPKDKVLNMSHLATKIISEKIINIMDTSISIDQICNLDEKKISHKHELIKYNFKFKDDFNINDKLNKLKKIKKADMLTYINNKMGNICQMAVMLGWILGCGDEKQLHQIEKLGTHIAIIIKISNDFNNIESDLLKLENHNITSNFIINYGIQEAFELFINSKQKFIEIAITLDIYTNTIKDIINIIEEKIDIVIDKTTPDMRSLASVSTKSVNLTNKS